MQGCASKVERAGAWPACGNGRTDSVRTPTCGITRESVNVVELFCTLSSYLVELIPEHGMACWG